MLLTSILDNIDDTAVSVPYSLLGYTRVDVSVRYAVRVESGGLTWITEKRFKDFEELDSALRRVAKGLQHSLPAKSGLFGASTNSSRKLIERRRVGLDKYANAVLLEAVRNREAAALLDAFFKPADEPHKKNGSIDQNHARCTSNSDAAEGHSWVPVRATLTLWHALSFGDIHVARTETRSVHGSSRARRRSSITSVASSSSSSSASSRRRSPSSNPSPSSSRTSVPRRGAVSRKVLFGVDDSTDDDDDAWGPSSGRSWEEDDQCSLSQNPSSGGGALRMYSERLLPSLPWASHRLAQKNGFNVLASSGEKRGVVRGRWAEFCAFCDWFSDAESHGDGIPTAQETLFFLAGHRARNEYQQFLSLGDKERRRSRSSTQRVSVRSVASLCDPAEFSSITITPPSPCLAPASPAQTPSSSVESQPESSGVPTSPKSLLSLPSSERRGPRSRRDAPDDVTFSFRPPGMVLGF